MKIVRMHIGDEVRHSCSGVAYCDVDWDTQKEVTGSILQHLANDVDRHIRKRLKDD